jgi:hypothetical protein
VPIFFFRPENPAELTFTCHLRAKCNFRKSAKFSIRPENPTGLRLVLLFQRGFPGLRQSKCFEKNLIEIILTNAIRNYSSNTLETIYRHPHRLLYGR